MSYLRGASSKAYTTLGVSAMISCIPCLPYSGPITRCIRQQTLTLIHSCGKVLSDANGISLMVIVSRPLLRFSNQLEHANELFAGPLSILQIRRYPPESLISLPPS